MRSLGLVKETRTLEEEDEDEDSDDYLSDELDEEDFDDDDDDEEDDLDEDDEEAFSLESIRRRRNKRRKLRKLKRKREIISLEKQSITTQVLSDEVVIHQEDEQPSNKIPNLDKTNETETVTIKTVETNLKLTSTQAATNSQLSSDKNGKLID